MRLRYYSKKAYVPSQHWALARGVRPALLMEGVRTEVERTIARHAQPGGHREVAVERHADGSVDLVVATRRGLARRILDARRDPVRGAAESGRLLGYPACCVRAFIDGGLPGHDDLGHFRQALRRTRGAPRGLLNPLCDLAVVPFVPCRFDCPRALRLARATLAACPPDEARTIRRILGMPILLWTDLDIVFFEGRATKGRVRYRRAGVNEAAPDFNRRRLLSGPLARGNSLEVEGAQVIVRRGKKTLLDASFAPWSPLLVGWR